MKLNILVEIEPDIFNKHHAPMQLTNLLNTQFKGLKVIEIKGVSESE